MILILFIFVCAFVTVMYYFNVNKNYWKKRNVVQVNYAAWHFLLGKCSLPEVYRNIYNAYPNENYVGMFFNSKPVLVLKNLEDIRAVLKDSHCFHSRGYYVNEKEDLIDNLLLMNDYHRWKLIRQRISPVFTIKKLKSMSRTIYQCSDSLIDYIKNYQCENNKSVYEKFNFVAIGSAIFGVDFVTKNALQSPFVNALCNPLPFFHRCLFSLKLIISIQFPTLLKILNIKIFDDYKNLILEVIQKVSKYRQETHGKRDDYIDMYMEIQNDESIQDATGYKVNIDQFVASQAFSFFVAGVETTANAVDYTLLELANNKHILQKVHKEIDVVFHKYKELNYNNVESLEYLEMVLSEAMRKYPPIGSMQRVATEDAILPSNLKVTKGVYVIIPIYALHMDTKYFEEPDKFDPERFSSENINKIKKYTYLPFSGGNRICVGAKYARLHMKIMLAVLLREYTLKGCMYRVTTFEPNLFTLSDSNVQYELIPREKRV
ncbi:cytochrome P450 6j1-like [Pieris brassicae]|uniref:cytochrome P450 6j1-like n=1 Tax=Pieris brassicae TaxID=7116 RepID=UPI001E65F8B4|nr:cytochrome P450 6j1-like [Pieris brassicae]